MFLSMNEDILKMLKIKAKEDQKQVAFDEKNREELESLLPEYQSGAEKDDPKSLHQLALYYLWYGDKSCDTFYKAKLLCEREIRQNYAPACPTVAAMYYNDMCIKRNVRKSLELYQKGIDLGDIYSYLSLGEIFLNDKKDPTKAAEYFLGAADLENNIAFFYIGQMLLEGNGI